MTELRKRGVIEPPKSIEWNIGKVAPARDLQKKAVLLENERSARVRTVRVEPRETPSRLNPGMAKITTTDFPSTTTVFPKLIALLPSAVAIGRRDVLAPIFTVNDARDRGARRTYSPVRKQPSGRETISPMPDDAPQRGSETLTREGAERLARAIKTYWARRGVEADVYILPAPELRKDILKAAAASHDTTPRVIKMANEAYIVRSTMKHGLPKGVA